MDQRILVISQRFWPEDTKINEICKGFTERGYKVDVLCGQPNYPEGRFYKGYHTFGHEKEKFGKVRVLRAAEIMRYNSSGIRILMNYYSFTISALLKSLLLQKISYDAILIYQRSPVMMVGAGLRIGKKQNIPVVTYAVDVWPYSFYQEMDMQNGILRNIFRNVSKRMYLGSDKIIAASENAVRFFISELHIHPNKVKFIPLCADKALDEEDSDVTVQEQFAGSFNIVLSARADESLDFDNVINAASKLLKDGYADIKFIFVGNGPDLPQMRKKVNKAHLEDIIFFVPQDNKRRLPVYFDVANALLSVTKSEVRGEYAPVLDIVDYMTAAKPIIAASGSRERHLVKVAKCGITSDPGDSKGLYEAIMKLYRSSKETLEAYGQNARSYSRENFNRELRIEDILDVLFMDQSPDDDGFIINRSTNIIKIEDF